MVKCNDNDLGYWLFYSPATISSAFNDPCASQRNAFGKRDEEKSLPWQKSVTFEKSKEAAESFDHNGKDNFSQEKCEILS